MMQIEINEQTVDRQLVDAGIGKDAEEQAVRPMFFHLFCAIRYYRDMTYAEKVKAGFLYRTKFKNVYSLTGFFKERKRNRDKKSSPLHPSYKEESGVLGKDYKLHIQQGGGASLLETRQKAFWDACLKFEPEYFEIVDAITLQPIAEWSEAGKDGAVGCIAVWLDGVRLIDIVKF